MHKILTAMNALPQPTTVTDEFFAHLRDSPELPDFDNLPEDYYDWTPEELQADNPPDDTPYNSWERWPWGYPGNNGLLTL